IRLELVGRMIDGLSGGNKRCKTLAPIFEKLVFSPLSTCSPIVYVANVQRAKALYNTLEKYRLFDAYPEILYKTTFITKFGERTEVSLEPGVKLSLFNDVVAFLINAKLPTALHILFDIMLASSPSLFGKDDERRIATFEKILSAAFAMSYEHITLLVNNHDTGTKQAWKVPLLGSMIDCMMDDTTQRITYSDQDAASKGYPLIKRLVEQLVSLCVEENRGPVTTDEFVTITLYLLTQAKNRHFFATEAQYVEILKVYITAPFLQKTCTTKYWEKSLKELFALLACDMLSLDGRHELFRQFIIALAQADEDKARAFLNEGLKKSFYRGKLLEDKELSSLLRKV
ncbi:MAG: hypothetical protein JSR46_09775, partial [Verrucomicrobia bacterium]|nr:hypothetical protein [Verrucomicrobiota bacterium]